ncbi:hypothetical protein ACIQD3_11465 [Peribacillus loiseleuriae]|uniref:hypothetical protein n=1 Tax=Peribacillus loiseleuriae TaxID=1679170 RepID=UPI0037FC98A3
MKQEDTPFILKGKRKLFEPTGQALLEQLEDITIILIKQEVKYLDIYRIIPTSKPNESSSFVGTI